LAIGSSIFFGTNFKTISGNGKSKAYNNSLIYKNYKKYEKTRVDMFDGAGMLSHGKGELSIHLIILILLD